MMQLFRQRLLDRLVATARANPSLGRNFEAHGPARVARTDRGPHPRPRQASPPLPWPLRLPQPGRPPSGGGVGGGGVRALTHREERKRRPPSWARLIHKVYHADPLVCRQCGGELKITAYVSDGILVKGILAELGLSPPEEERPPPIQEVVRVPGRRRAARDPGPLKTATFDLDACPAKGVVSPSPEARQRRRGPRSLLGLLSPRNPCSHAWARDCRGWKLPLSPLTAPP
jgi:hypothetical protein